MRWVLACCKRYKSQQPENYRAYYRKHIKKARQYYADNREALIDYQIKRAKDKRAEIKRKLVEEHGGQCKVCRYSKCINALDFHHKDPSQKKFNITERPNDYRTFDEIREEAKKCILICCRCHRELHAGLIQLPEEGV